MGDKYHGMGIYSVEHYQKNFDSILKKVENGEKVLITNGNELAELKVSDEDFIRLHTEWNDDAS
jgi:PHD/YefM family antitoxin component YafN of YafNO toxin-antitoxin module